MVPSPTRHRPPLGVNPPMITPRRTRLRTAVTTIVVAGLALIGAVVAAPAASATAPAATTLSPGAAGATGSSGTRTVTLLTGDKVHVMTSASGPGAITVDPAPGSGGVQTQQIGSDTYVIPDAALPYLAAGTLD